MKDEKSRSKPRQTAARPPAGEGLRKGGPATDALRSARAERGKAGRPPNTPDKWTPEYIALLIEDMERYTASVPYPTEAEFCYTRHVHPQRFREHEGLRDALTMLCAKRQSEMIKRGMSLGPKEAALGAFLKVMVAHAGPFSMHDKIDAQHSGSIGVVIVDDIPASGKKKE